MHTEDQMSIHRFTSLEEARVCARARAELYKILQLDDVFK